tara:strand:+ start:8680 stop:9162 length:483 start_codon:yes stop_codon:yes gene_type:complete
MNMAENKEIKRVYNVPLRREFLKSAKWKRTKKASKALKEFLAKHMKADIDNVKIGKNLNEHMWKHGIKNPPHHVKVNVVKDKEGIVKAELEGIEYKSFKKEEKQEKTKMQQAVEKLKGKPKAEKKVKESKKEETKPEVKKETPKKEEPKKEEKKPEAKKQ